MTDPEQSELEAVVRQIAQEQLGQEIHAIEPIAGLGKINAVFRVDCNDRHFVIRLRPTKDLEANYAKEAWCLEHAAKASIPVPRVCAHGDIGPYSYIAEDYIAGNPASSTDVDSLLLWGRLGAYAARINSISVSGHGHRMSVETPGVFLDSWEDWSSELQARAFRDAYWTDAGIFPREHVEVLRASLERCGHVSAPGGLVHIDLGEWNVLLGEGGVDDLCIIDWDLTVAGPVPHYQLACTWCNTPNVDAYDAFASGYGLSRLALDSMHEDVTALIVLELLSGLRWTQDNRPEDVPEESQSTRRLVYELYADRLH